MLETWDDTAVDDIGDVSVLRLSLACVKVGLLQS